jgi:hypothetical protein
MSSKSSFERPRHLRVHWDDEPDHELHGAVIFMKRLSVDGLKELSTMDVPESDDEAPSGAAFDLIVGRLTEGLVSWNLTDDGEPRPATSEELRSDAALCMALLERWMDVAGSPSGPLGRRSNNGSASPEVSALTALPSVSL